MVDYIRNADYHNYIVYNNRDCALALLPSVHHFIDVSFHSAYCILFLMVISFIFNVHHIRASS